MQPPLASTDATDVKRRNLRPWWRKKRWVTALILLVALVVGVWFVLGVLYPTPRIATDYRGKLQELVAQSQLMPPGAENAWPEILAVVEKIPACIEQVNTSAIWGNVEPVLDYQLLYEEVNTSEWKGATREQVAAAARQYITCLGEAGVFSDLGRIAGMKYAARQIVDEPLAFYMLYEVGRIRGLSRVCAARMAVACEQHDVAGWSSAARQAIGLANHISRQPTPIEHLVGVAITNLIVNELRYGLMAVPNDPMWITAAEEVMNTINLGPSRVAYEGERIITHDVIQRVCTDNGFGDGRIIFTELARFTSGDPGTPVPDPDRTWRDRPIGNFMGLIIPGRKANARAVDEFFDLLNTVDTLPHDQRWHAIDRLESMLNETDHDRLIIAAIYLPAVRKFQQSIDRTRSVVHGTRLMLAIERFKSAHARPPANLLELVPAFLPELPIDPINGKSFGYKAVPGSSTALGSGYVLYSFGCDGEDNDGRIAEDPRLALNYERGEGYDYPFNRAKDPFDVSPPETKLSR